MIWKAVYEHDRHGEIEVWFEIVEGEEPRLVAIQAGLFVPAEEVEILVELARNLQVRKDGESGDADADLPWD